MRGSVVQKPKGTGRWYVVLDLDRDGTGRRRQKWHSGFRTKREAEKGLTALLAAQDTGTNVAPQKITLGEYLADRWLPAIEATVRPTTFAGYRAHVRVYVNPALGSIPLQSVTADQLSTFYLQLHRAGGREGASLAPTTVRRAHATLHRAFRDAMSWGYLNRNPAALAVKPKQRSPGSVEMKTWTVADVRRFLDHVQEDRLFPAWRLAASTGLRRGELLGLRWQDVDLDTGRVSVRQTLTTVGNKVAFGDPKTARGKRNIALDGVTIGALRMWRPGRPKSVLRSGRRGITPVWCSAERTVR
jgi:integrase